MVKEKIKGEGYEISIKYILHKRYHKIEKERKKFKIKVELQLGGRGGQLSTRGRRFEPYFHQNIEVKIVVAYYQEREERLSCETKFEGSTTLTTTFVTLSSNNYKSLLFLQISFNILSCHILLISIYSISTLSSLPSIIPVIPSSLSRYLLSTQPAKSESV